MRLARARGRHQQRDIIVLTVLTVVLSVACPVTEPPADPSQLVFFRGYSLCIDPTLGSENYTRRIATPVRITTRRPDIATTS